MALKSKSQCVRTSGNDDEKRMNVRNGQPALKYVVWTCSQIRSGEGELKKSEDFLICIFLFIFTVNTALKSILAYIQFYFVKLLRQSCLISLITTAATINSVC
jgi:hypothetical protein